MAEKTEKDLPILVDDVDIADDTSLDQVIELLGGKTSNDILLKVYREIGNKEIEWCFDASPDALPLEPFLLSEYGGGVFVVHIYSPTRRGNKGKRKEVTIRVAKRLTPPTPPANQIETLVDGMMRANAEMMRQFAEQQRLALENTLLRSGAANSAAPQGLTVEGLLQLMPVLKQMGGGESKGGVAQLKDALALINEMRELAPAGGGDGNELLGYVKVIADLAKNAPRPLPVAHQQSDAEFLESMGRSPAPRAESTSEGDMFGIVLKGKLWELCDAAARGGRPDVYAEVILDQVPEQYYPDLLDLIGDDDATALKNLSQISPRVKEFQPWFAELAALIRGAFVADALTAATGDGISAAETQGKATDVSDAAPGAGEPANKTGSDTGRP